MCQGWLILVGENKQKKWMYLVMVKKKKKKVQLNLGETFMQTSQTLQRHHELYFVCTNIYYFNKPAETDSLRWESKDINQTINKINTLQLKIKNNLKLSHEINKAPSQF